MKCKFNKQHPNSSLLNVNNHLACVFFSALNNMLNFKKLKASKLILK